MALDVCFWSLTIFYRPNGVFRQRHKRLCDARAVTALRGFSKYFFNWIVYTLCPGRIHKQRKKGFARVYVPSSLTQKLFKFGLCEKTVWSSNFFLWLLNVGITACKDAQHGRGCLIQRTKKKNSFKARSPGSTSLCAGNSVGTFLLRTILTHIAAPELGSAEHAQRRTDANQSRRPVGTSILGFEQSQLLPKKTSSDSTRSHVAEDSSTRSIFEAKSFQRHEMIWVSMLWSSEATDEIHSSALWKMLALRCKIALRCLTILLQGTLLWPHSIEWVQVEKRCHQRELLQGWEPRSQRSLSLDSVPNSEARRAL